MRMGPLLRLALAAAAAALLHGAAGQTQWLTNMPGGALYNAGPRWKWDAAETGASGRRPLAAFAGPLRAVAGPLRPVRSTSPGALGCQA